MDKDFKVPRRIAEQMFLDRDSRPYYFDEFRAIQCALAMLASFGEPVYIAVVPSGSITRFYVTREIDGRYGSCYRIDSVSVKRTCVPELELVALKQVELAGGCDVPMISCRYYVLTSEKVIADIETIREPGPKVRNVYNIVNGIIEPLDLIKQSANGRVSIGRPFSNRHALIAIALDHDAVPLQYSWGGYEHPADT